MRRIVLIMSIICAAYALAMPGTGTAAEDSGKDPFFPPERNLLAPAAPSAEDGWGRDPFSSPLSEETPVSAGRPAAGLRITGIVFSRNARIVLIDGEMYREGSMVGDRRVIEIRRRSVIFKTPTGDYEELYVSDITERR